MPAIIPTAAKIKMIIDAIKVMYLKFSRKMWSKTQLTKAMTIIAVPNDIPNNEAMIPIQKSMFDRGFQFAISKSV